MRARWLSIDLTPTGPVSLGGTGPGRVARRVADPLQANLCLLGGDDAPVVLVAIDTLFVGAGLAPAIARRTGLDPQRLVVVASHSHSAPSLAPEVSALGGTEADYQDFAIDRLTAATAELRAMPATKVTASAGRRTAPLNTNRRRPAFVIDYHAIKEGRIEIGRRIALAENRAGPVDPMVRALLFRGEDGRPPLVLWSFAAHPAFFPDRAALSADYPGRVRAAIRARLGDDACVLYLPGLAGSAVPRIPFSLPRSPREAVLRMLPFYPMLRRFTVAGFERWSRALESAVLAALDDSAGVELDDAPALSRGVAPEVMRGSSDGTGVDLNLCDLRLGPSVRLLLFSGEMVGEWDPLIRRQIGPEPIASGYLGGLPFYVPTDQVAREGGYEGGGFRRYFGIDAEFADGLDSRVCDALRGLHEPD